MFLVVRLGLTIRLILTGPPFAQYVRARLLEFIHNMVCDDPYVNIGKHVNCQSSRCREAHLRYLGAKIGKDSPY